MNKATWIASGMSYVSTEKLLCSYVREGLDAWSPIRNLLVDNIKCVTHKQRKRFAEIRSSTWVQKFATVNQIYRVYANELRIKCWMSIQTVRVFHNSEFIFEMKLISFAFVQVIQLRAVFAAVIAKHKNSSLRRKPYNYRRNIVFHGAFQEILRNIVSCQKRNISTFPRVIAFRKKINNFPHFTIYNITR